MSLFLHQVLAIFRKDLLIEFRKPDHFLSVLLFGGLLLLLFSFGLSVEPALMRRMAPGLFWLAILFVAILTLEHSFQAETEDGQWEGLLLAGTSPRALYLGKLLGNVSLLLVTQLTLLPLMAVLYDLNLSFGLVSVLLLGGFGIAALGTAYVGLTATLKGGQTLLPLLLFPMLVPLLLAAVELTRLTLAQDLFGQDIVWLKLLILFDIVFGLGSLVTAPALFDRF